MVRRSGQFAPLAGFRGSSEPPLEKGTVVASTFKIGSPIAITDTGVLFEAHDLLLDRLVALKLAWRDAGTPSLVVEARRCAAVRDACAVQIHAMGRHLDTEYAVAERLTGKLLRDEVQTTLPSDVYLARLRKLTAAVARAHEAGIAVGDISGSTVLVDDEGRLVLGRLSLSQVPSLGPHGQILAPEVVRGDVDPLDPAAAEAIDLYGLGCVAIEMACGSPPFADDERTVELKAHVTQRPPRITDLRPDLPTELSDLVDWLLVKEPKARPRTARDVLLQVEAVRDRIGPVTRSIRVLIVDDDTARARWLWGLARRSHAATIVEIASEGSDAAHKLNRDQPDLVFIDAQLRGAMNALELCMYARGLESWHHTVGQMFLIGSVSERDAALLDKIEAIPDDVNLANALIDRIRSVATAQPRRRKPRTTVSG